MQQSDNPEAAQWIWQRTDPPSAKGAGGVWRGVPVSRLLPRGFDSYIQILQPVWRQFADSLVTDLLTSFTQNQNCWFHYFIPPRLYSGEIWEIKNFLKELPEYWWPEDRSWCVNSDWDLDFTLVGGCSELIRAFVGNCDLFAVEVSLDTRVDHFGDARGAQKEIGQVADAALAGTMSLSLAALAAYRLRLFLGEEFEAVLQPLLAIERETRYLPVGPVRDLWAPEALLSKDAEVRRIEDSYRSKALKSCRKIKAMLRSYGTHPE